MGLFDKTNQLLPSVNFFRLINILHIWQLRNGHSHLKCIFIFTESLGLRDCVYVCGEHVVFSAKKQNVPVTATPSFPAEWVISTFYAQASSKMFSLRGQRGCVLMCLQAPEEEGWGTAKERKKALLWATLEPGTEKKHERWYLSLSLPSFFFCPLYPSQSKGTKEYLLIIIFLLSW